MKKLLVALISVLLMGPLFAGDFAKLRVKISGPIKDNRYFLCFSGLGCVSVLNGNKGRTFPLHPGSVSSFRTLNFATKSMQVQTLPRSCNATSGRTVTITGQIIESGNRYALRNVGCRVN